MWGWVSIEDISPSTGSLACAPAMCHSKWGFTPLTDSAHVQACAISRGPSDQVSGAQGSSIIPGRTPLGAPGEGAAWAGRSREMHAHIFKYKTTCLHTFRHVKYQNRCMCKLITITNSALTHMHTYTPLTGHQIRSSLTKQGQGRSGPGDLSRQR